MAIKAENEPAIWIVDIRITYPVELFYYIDVYVVIWAISMYIVDLVNID